MVVYKLPTPKAELYINNSDENPANYISVEAVENARYYSFTAVKYSEDGGSIVKTHTFEKYQINSTQDYFETQTIEDKTYILFNLQAVADLDALIPDQPNPFGQQFSIYVQVFGIDRTYDYDLETIYAISNESNYVAVEVPITPTNLVVNSVSGLISWVNSSNNTKTRIRIYYNNSPTPTIYTVNEGVNTFKLETIGSFNVSVLSYITASNDIEISSSYTEPVTGTFAIFNSGSGKQEDPYILTESEHLLNIDYYPDSYYELGNTITLKDSDLENIDGFLIGKSGGTFNGTIDGKGFAIKNLQFAYNASQIAMIKEIGQSGVVKNLEVGIKTGTNRYLATTFAGIALTNRGTISNVTTTKLTEHNGDGEVVYSPTNNQRVSGFVDENYGTITRAVNNMNLGYQGSGSQGMNTIVAGLVARNYGQITQSANTASLKGTLVGGLVQGNFGTISECYNVGAISAVSVNTNVQAQGAGIAVSNLTQGSYSGKIEKCYAILSSFVVTGVAGSTNAPIAGGIVANNGSQVMSNCYVAITNAITTSSGTRVGALVGMDNRGNFATYYTDNYYYLASGTLGSLGTSGTEIATKASNKNDLVTTLTANFGEIYVYDTQNINEGFPIFAWQVQN